MYPDRNGGTLIPLDCNCAMCETVPAWASWMCLQALAWTLERTPPLEVELVLGGEEAVGVLWSGREWEAATWEAAT